MILQCKRDRQKEFVATGEALNFLRWLNNRNIQHFNYNSLTCEITYIKDGRTTSFISLVTPYTIDKLCNITNKNKQIEELIQQYQKHTTDVSEIYAVRGLFTSKPFAEQDIFMSQQYNTRVLCQPEPILCKAVDPKLFDFLLKKAGFTSLEQAKLAMTRKDIELVSKKTRLSMLKTRLELGKY